MQNKTVRALGATAVLVGIAIAAMAQTSPTDPSAIEMAAPAATESTPVAPTTMDDRSTTTSEPFEYRIGLLAGPSTANFWDYIGERPTAWNAYVLGPTKPALFGIDPTSNALIPDLASGQPSEPTWDEEGWRVRIELGDLSWSDGVVVTAADVVYTFETVRRLGLQGGWAAAYPSEVEEIVAESDRQLRIELSRRPSLRIWPMGIGLAPIMPAHVWRPLTDPLNDAAALYALSGDADVSGGPLRVTSMSEERILSEANPGYPSDGPATVVYTVYPDETAAVAALKGAEIDTILSPGGLSAENGAALESEPGIALERSPANAVRYLGFNLSRAPMSEPAFRQAVALVVDREAVTRSLVPGASAAYTMLTPANESWYDEDRAAAITEKYAGDLTQRVEMAVSGLKSAGYTWSTQPSVVDGELIAGVGLTIQGRPTAPLTILTPGDEYDPARPDYTQLIEVALESLGFDVRPVVTDFDTVVDLAFNVDDSGSRQYDMYLLGWTLGNPALPDFHRRLFASDGDFNSTGYADPGFESHLAGFERATDIQRARNALWDMEDTLADDLPYLVLYHPDIVEAYRSDRLTFAESGLLGGIQARLGGLGDLTPAP